MNDKDMPAAVAGSALFDFDTLDPETANKLRGITDCVLELQHTYAWGMAYQVGRAHDLLCGADASCPTVGQLYKANGNRGESTFSAWCASLGIIRSTAYNLLNAYRLICEASSEQQAVLQVAPAKLLYAAGKPGAPSELVEGVKSGDITSHKQYQALLAEIQSREQKISELLESSEAAERREQSLKDRYHVAHANEEAALRRAKEIEEELKELQARPVEVAVQLPNEECIEQYRKEGEQAALRQMQASLAQAKEGSKAAKAEADALRRELDELKPDKDSCQRIVDALCDAVDGYRAMLRTSLRAAALDAKTYQSVTARALSATQGVYDTIRSLAPDGCDIQIEEDYL